MKETTVKIKTMRNIKRAIKRHKKLWLTMDGKGFVYAELRKSGQVWINYGLSDQVAGMKKAVMDIHDFLSFENSINQL